MKRRTNRVAEESTEGEFAQVEEDENETVPASDLRFGDEGSIASAWRSFQDTFGFRSRESTIVEVPIINDQ
jgi:hypothetical protein